ncbi:urease accessory protein UreF [Rhizobium sp. FKY42]|uniref:urease accessory protein UreF n=1 Tax=Rhizobium sp. FKY42 TaxID=2562310 RepID=UPI0010C0925E|nr:urease accessory protein UreF [Rhizobium sp. FKY42]
MSAAFETQALLRLMTWLSPAFPVGGFAYSSGLERAVHDRLVTDAVGLEAWLSTSVRHGMLWNDAVFVSLAAQVVEEQVKLAELAELGLALAGSAERHMETLSLGKAFLAAAEAWPASVFGLLPPDCPYPVAVGAVAAAHRIGAEQAIAAFLHAGVSQGVSAGIRLGVAGQQDGLRILSALETIAGEVAERAAAAGLDDLGSATVQADIASLRHERQNSRLFRS